MCKIFLCKRIKPERIGISVCKTIYNERTFSTHQIYILEQKHKRISIFFEKRKEGLGVRRKEPKTGGDYVVLVTFGPLRVRARGVSTTIYGWVLPKTNKVHTYIHTWTLTSESGWCQTSHEPTRSRRPWCLDWVCARAHEHLHYCYSSA